jgi:hypothetical protein
MHRHVRGIELLRKHVHKHALVDPALEYIDNLYFPGSEPDLVSDLPRPHEYECCREFLFQTLRRCNQLDRRWGTARKVARENARQRRYVEKQIAKGIAERHKSDDGATVLFLDGDALSSILKNESQARYELAECQEVCQRRLEDWTDRGY